MVVVNLIRMTLLPRILLLWGALLLVSPKQLHWCWLPAVQGTPAADVSSSTSSDGRRPLPSEDDSATTTKQQRKTLRRALPEKVIVGYATTCDAKVVTAVQQGVNVVIWAFFYFKPPTSSAPGAAGERRAVQNNNHFEISGAGMDLKCIRNMIQQLDQQGYNDTVHLASMGGWNGPHLNPDFSTAESWFDTWKELVGHIFHGIDIDFEGNDDMTSPLNYFSVETLELTGQILQLATQDGYITSLVPAQSYLDIASSKFSRYVNWTDPDRGGEWHDDFSYFGQNVYAYLLAKYPDAVDMIMIQFYESYSRASYEIHYHNMAPEAYLSMYVQDLSNRGQVFEVDFASSDPAVGIPNQRVALPISKLVWGFSSTCATRPDDTKCLYIPAECIQAAYQELWDWMMEPRGLMFWVIDYEGTNGLYYAKELNSILHIRSTAEIENDVGKIE